MQNFKFSTRLINNSPVQFMLNYGMRHVGYISFLRAYYYSLSVGILKEAISSF